MLRRCKGWDYKGRGIYMLTLVVRNRKRLLGSLIGNPYDAHVEYTELGKSVNSEVEKIPAHFPQIRILGKQVMPDHLHMLLFVEKPLPVHLTSVVSGFKYGCNCRYWDLLPEVANTGHTKDVSCAADFQEAGKMRGFWEDGYHDRILFHTGQLEAMMRYIHDNPRRALIKHTHPDLFKIREIGRAHV